MSVASPPLPAVPPSPAESAPILHDGHLSAGHVLEQNAHARLLSRLLLAVGAVVYLAWHFVHQVLQPGAIDPLGERLGFLVFVAALIGLSFHPAGRRHLVLMGYAAVAVGTTHYFSLVARNAIATPYLVGVFIALGAVSALLVGPRAVLAYAGLTVGLAAVVAVACVAPAQARLELIVGTATVQIGLSVSAWRNRFLLDTARELAHARRQIRQLQGLLPICMHCNRIRTTGNQWERIEAYLSSRTEATFTHSLCLECADRHYPEAFRND